MPSACRMNRFQDGIGKRPMTAIVLLTCRVAVIVGVGIAGDVFGGIVF